jgi:hypothetical protein
MVSNSAEPIKRSGLDVCDYAVVCTGFFTAVSAVIVSSLGWALAGLFMMLGGLAYFFAQDDE